MLTHLTCPRGHKWDVDDVKTTDLAAAPDVCPVCGIAMSPRPKVGASPPEPDAPTLPPVPAQVDYPGRETEEVPVIVEPDSRRNTPSSRQSRSKVVAAEAPSIAGYEILKEVGRGGMGVVYKAREVALKRVVALKMILAGVHAGTTEVHRFRREAEAVARLQHPNIVQVYGIGESGGRPYFSMEFVAGGGLGDRLRGNPWPAERAARLMEVLARAMHAAHRSGVVHRDLKPANVLLTADGRPKITDFGLAKRIDGGGTGPTQSGAILGTPSYMAPEQADARGEQIGPAADIYALGAILYELLTGRPPFRAETPLDTVLQVVNEEPVPPSRLNAKVPRDLETICLKCLRKEPKKRYATALALAADLRCFQAGETIQARRVGTGERAAKWVRRRPALAALIATLHVAALGVLIGGIWFTLKLNQARVEAVKKADEAHWNLYVAQMNVAQRDYEANNITHVQELLDNWVPKDAPEKDLRGFEWYYWRRLTNRALQVFRHPSGVHSVAFSQDGSRLATASNDGLVMIWEPTSGRRQFSRQAQTGGLSSMAMSSDGNRLATGSQDGTVKLWPAIGGEVLRTFRAHKAAVTSLAFSPKGDHLVTGSADKTAKAWDTSTGQELFSLQDHGNGVSSVACSGDGKYIATGSHDGRARLWDANSGKVLRTFKGHTDQVLGVAFSPDNTRLATASKDRTARMWETATGDELRKFTHSDPVRCVAFSSDGRRLATGSEDRTTKVWDTLNGGELLSIPTDIVVSVAFIPSNQPLSPTRIATGSMDFTAKIWDATGVEQSKLWHTDELSSLAFSPDGARLISGSKDGTANIWNVATGQAIREIRQAGGLVAISPDGRRLATAVEGTVKIWDATSGAELQGFPAHTVPVSSLIFASANRLATASGDGTAKIWDINGRLDRTLSGHTDGVLCLALSPDGARLATGGLDGAVKVWDVASGQTIFDRLAHAGGVSCVAFSPDSTRLATVASSDKTAWIWDVSTGQPPVALKGHANGLLSVAFSPDIHHPRLATGSKDHTAKLWDPVTGQELLTFKRHTAAVSHVAFSPDGARLATGSEDQTVYIWESPASAESSGQR